MEHITCVHLIPGLEVANQPGQNLAIKVKCYFSNISRVGVRFHPQVSHRMVFDHQLNIELVTLKGKKYEIFR